MRVRSCFCRAVLIAAIASVSPLGASAQTPPAVTVGQAVEVREGDTWSKAKVTAREGRRVQIQYDDGTQEWVTSDRVRTPATPGTPGTPAPAAKPDAAKPADAKADDAEQPAAKKPAAKRFANGKKVEVKWGGTWSEATIKNSQREWYLVTYDRGGRLEWVEPWRVREVGSSYDTEYARPNPSMNANRIEPPPRDKPGPAPAADGQEAAESVDWPVTDADFNKAKTVAIGIVPWTYTPPAEPIAPGRITERAIGLSGGMGDGADRMVALDVNGTVALLAYQEPFGRKGSVAEVVHLGTGEPVARADLGADTQPMAVAPDGRRVAGRGGDKAKGRVDVWDLGGGEPKHVVSFLAYTKAGDFFKDVERVMFVDATHLITLNAFNGHLIAWEVGPGVARAAWHVKMPQGAEVALSADRRTFAAAGGGQLVLGDALTGELKGTIETSAQSLSSLSFRGDGRRVCAMGGPTLFEFDLESGKQTASLGLPAPLSGGEARHLAGETVAVQTKDGQVVLDVAKRSLLGLFKADGVQFATTAADKFVAAIRADKRRVLNAWTIPMKGRPDKATPLAVVPSGAGTKIALDVQVEADDATRKQVVDALTRQVAARGWTIGEPASLRLVARTTAGKSEQREYGSGPSFGPFAGPRETVTVTERIVRFSVEVDGKSAWATQASSTAGFMLSRKEGQSMQQAADEAGRYNVGFLQTVTLPETIFAPIDTLPAGVPTFTLANGGVRPN